MRTVGQILKEEREKQFYSLADIEKATKIRKELLELLEADNFAKLPPTTFVQGFIRNYGKFLGLDPNKLLAVFRREFADHKHPPRILDSFTHPIDKNSFRFTPTKIISVLVVSLILAFFIYLWFEYRFLVGAPILEVDRPTDQQTISASTVEVAGKTNPEAKVSINNQEVAVDANGKFSEEIKVTESSSKITVTATSKFGKTSEVDRTVFLKQ
jgi:cytoskeletal protein RodZ